MSDHRTDFFERMTAYYAAPVEERCRMIRESYERMEAGRLAERRAGYDARHGTGAFDRLLAEIAASPPPGKGPSSVAFARPQDGFGYWEYGRG